MVFPERGGPKELEVKREREELWDLQEDRESKASREILALKESREKKVNNKITMIIITMITTKVKLIKKKKGKKRINNLWSKTITIIEIIEMVSFELSKELKMIFRLEKRKNSESP